MLKQYSPIASFAALQPSRIRHNRDKGADVQQGPTQRFLFRLRPRVNLFYCLLLFTSSGYSIQPRRMSTYWHVATSGYCTYLDTRGLLLRALFSPAYVIKTEYLRECLASRVWPYMHQLRIMSLVKCWVCPAPTFWYLTFCYIGKVALGELLRLCPGSSG